ncbi:hypothetical protein PARMER_00047 [Parabacteroides merdae ATCC 43184]|nr:hypothetical protein PARMER_00047 [Parabacteroides merdae ATCC 43184]
MVLLARFSLFCLYIQNGLNLFLLTAIYICAGEKKNSILLFASITFMIG